MRRFTASLLHLAATALLTLPVCAGATIALISAGSGGYYSASGTTAVTSSLNTIGATLIVVACASSAGAPSGVTNSGTADTWNSGASYGSGTTYYVRLFYAYAPTVSSSQTFTCTASSGQIQITVLAFSGTLTSSSVYQTATGQSNSGSTSTSPGSITPSQSGELYITAAANKDTSLGCSGMTTPSGFTTSGSTCGMYTLDTNSGYYIELGSTAVNPTWTFSGSSGISASSVMMAFLPATAINGVMLPMVEGKLNCLQGKSCPASLASAVIFDERFRRNSGVSGAKYPS